MKMNFENKKGGHACARAPRRFLPRPGRHTPLAARAAPRPRYTYTSHDTPHAAADAKNADAGDEEEAHEHRRGLKASSSRSRRIERCGQRVRFTFGEAPWHDAQQPRRLPSTPRAEGQGWCG